MTSLRVSLTALRRRSFTALMRKSWQCVVSQKSKPSALWRFRESTAEVPLSTAIALRESSDRKIEDFPAKTAATESFHRRFLTNKSVAFLAGHSVLCGLRHG